MKRVISVYQNLFLGKTPIVLVSLILLGSLIGGSLILHAMNHTNTIGNCSSSSVQSIAASASQSCAKVISHHQIQATRQINLKGEVVGSEILSVPRQIAPTPTPDPQPVNIYPTQVPTIPYPTSTGQAA